MLKIKLMLRHRLAQALLLGGTIISPINVVPPAQAVAPNDVFFVSKSDNGNQVHYGVETNPDCSLKGSTPAYPYWILENGRSESLLAIEVPVFGIASQDVSGQEVVIEVNGFRNRGISRPITMRSAQAGNQCQVSAFTEINSETTQLVSIHIDLVRQYFLFIPTGGTVHSITIFGADQNQETIVCESNCQF